MTCTNNNIKELLPALLARELDPIARNMLEQHLASCPDCSDDLALLRVVGDESVPDPGDVFWNSMPDRVYRTVVRETTDADKKHLDLSPLFNRLTWPRWVVAAATVCVLLVVASLGFRALQKEPDSDVAISQGDLYGDEVLSGSMNVAALNHDEITSIDAWAGSELSLIAQDADPVLAGEHGTDLFEELADFNAGEVDRLAHMISAWNEEV